MVDEYSDSRKRLLGQQQPKQDTETIILRAPCGTSLKLSDDLLCGMLQSALRPEDLVATQTSDLAFYNNCCRNDGVSAAGSLLVAGMDVSFNGRKAHVDDSAIANNDLTVQQLETGIHTASAIDYTADNLPRSLFMLLWSVEIAAHFAKLLKSSSDGNWSNTTCTEYGSGCPIAKGVDGWLALLFQPLYLRW
jgi:hypothetical protein